MALRPRIRCTAFVLLTLLSTGCKSPSEYANFAQAGNLYVAAIDNLLLAATMTGIDASSERLILDDKGSNTTPSAYDKQNKADKERIEVYKKLRAHARLLGRYFSALNALATSNAPSDVETSLTSLVTNINTLGTQLRGSPFFKGGGLAVASIGDLIVNSVIRGALHKELSARNKTIREELALQEALLRTAAKYMKDDLQTIHETEGQRLVVDPLTATANIADIEKWKENRRRILLYPTTIEELESASGAVSNLRQAFEDLLSNKLTHERIDSVLADLGGIVTVAELIQKELK